MIKNEKIHLAGYSLPELIGIYKKDLFQNFLPFLGNHVVDLDFGGFCCHMDRSGVPVTTDKRAWYDGRGIWVYSFLYRHFGKKNEYLDIAQKTVDFVLSLEPEEGAFWPWGYSRRGAPVNSQPSDIYGSLFVAEGLAEYSMATGDAFYRKKAKEILISCVNQYDREDYVYTPHYSTPLKNIPAPRVLGHWMILLNLCGHLLTQEEDSEVKQISDRCIEALMNHHLHPDFNLFIEYLNHDFSMPEEPLAQFSYIGHGIEVLWMLMAEAERREDRALYDRARTLFKRHVEVAWDDVYGGFFHCLEQVVQNKWELDKVLWAQEEVLIGLMMLIEKDQDAWAIRWFDKVYPYVRKNFILHDHPSRLWVNGGDRRLKDHHQIDRIENYHHPRHLMMNLLALERMG